MLRYIGIALLTLAAPVAASALPMSVEGGTWTPIGGTAESLTGSLNVDASLLSLDLVGSANTQIVASSLVVSWLDADTFTLAAGQTATVNGAQVTLGGTCNGGSSSLACGLIANSTAVRGTVTGLTAKPIGPMPEPHSLALFVVGALVVGTSIRRYV